MTVDKFGHSSISGKKKQPKNPLVHQYVLKFNDDGDIDFENIKILNVKTPTNAHDVANKEYVDNQLKTLDSLRQSYQKHVDNQMDEINSNIRKVEDVLEIVVNTVIAKKFEVINIQITEITKQISDIEAKFSNVKTPTDEHDVANKGYVDNQLKTHGSLHQSLQKQLDDTIEKVNNNFKQFGEVLDKAVDNVPKVNSLIAILTHNVEVINRHIAEIDKQINEIDSKISTL